MIRLLVGLIWGLFGRLLKTPAAVDQLLVDIPSFNHAKGNGFYFQIIIHFWSIQ